MIWREQWRKLRQLRKWERLMAKRSIKSRTVWVLIRIVVPVVLFAFVALASGTTMLSLAGAPEAVQGGLIALVAFAAGALLLYVDIMVVFNQLSSQPYELLLAAPFSGRFVLLARLSVSARSIFLYAALGVPLAVAYGIVQHAPAWYYLLAAVALILTVATLLALATLIVLAVLCSGRRRITRESLAFVSTGIAIAVVIVPRLIELGPVAQRMQADLLGPTFAWLPMVMGARAIIAGGLGQGSAAMISIILLAIICVVAAWLDFALADRFLHDRIGRVQEGSVTKSRGSGRVRTSQSRAGSLLLRPFSPAIRAMVRKDWTRLRRVPSELLGFAFSVVYFWVIIMHPDPGQSGGPTGMTLPWLVVLVIFSSNRLTLSSFGIEREQVVLLLSAPVSSREILQAKWLYTFGPSLVWTELVIAVFDVIAKTPLPASLWMALLTAWIVAGATMLSLPFAISGAAFVPRRAAQRTIYVKPGSSLSLLALVPYLALQGALMAFAMAPLLPGGGDFFTTFLVTGRLWHVALGVLLSLLLAALAGSIGWSTGSEAWRHRSLMILQSGSLE